MKKWTRTVLCEERKDYEPFLIQIQIQIQNTNTKYQTNTNMY